MKCDEVRERLTEYVDGEVTDVEAASIEVHVAECEACRAEFEALRRTAELVRSLPQAEPPAGLAARVVAAAGERVSARSRAVIFTWRRMGGLVAAAAALVIVIKVAPWMEPAPGRFRPSPAAPAGPEIAADEGARGSGTGTPLPAPESEPRDPRLERDEALDAAPPGAALGKAGGARRNGFLGGAAPHEAEAALADVAEDRAEGMRQFDAPAQTRTISPAYTYQCANIPDGRADVLKALEAVEGEIVAPDDADTQPEVLTVSVPPDRLPKLVAALGLKWLPARADAEAGVEQAPRAPEDAAAEEGHAFAARSTRQMEAVETARPAAAGAAAKQVVTADEAEPAAPALVRIVLQAGPPSEAATLDATDTLEIKAAPAQREPVEQEVQP